MSDSSKFHNEILEEYLSKYKDNPTRNTFDLIRRLIDICLNLDDLKEYRKELNEMDNRKVALEIFGTENYREFEFYNRVDISLKSLEERKEITSDFVKIINKMVQGNYSPSKTLETIKSYKPKNESEKKYLNDFQIIYNQSVEFWGDYYGGEPKTNKVSGCDPAYQEYLADAAGGVVGGLLTGGIGAGLAAVGYSALVHAMTEDNGGCI